MIFSIEIQILFGWRLSSVGFSGFARAVQPPSHPVPDPAATCYGRTTSSRDECARAAAVIRWVVQQSCACACTGAQLTRDLLVLGVPRTHASALADAVDNYRPEHVANVEANGFMNVTAAPGPEGTVDTFTLTLHSHDVFTGEQQKKELLIEKSQAMSLLEDLKKAYKKMEEIEE
ncbi:hypothetical protein HF086_006053 [Spodoptera exigua]|uniref:COMM domain-containing protein n=1 Tax=Spodoptera exigua TaxID=7107 RepID=A0A922MY15_SPOEX|nr:hypothetical protein HF086_006053 [Spodoptera exigua]